MIESILTTLAAFIIQAIETTQYGGIFVLMLLESANIPIPSEIIMPFAGYLVFEEKLNFFLVLFWGTMGNLAGSLISYYLGFFGGRAFLEKYGKFILITSHDLSIADSLFKKYGSTIIFASRVLPIVRTFISFPAGVAKMNIWKFTLYTLAGCFIWSVILTYAGIIAGANWHSLEDYFRKFDWLIAGIIVAGAVWWIWRHIKEVRKPA